LNTEQFTFIKRLTTTPPVACMFAHPRSDSPTCSPFLTSWNEMKKEERTWNKIKIVFPCLTKLCIINRTYSKISDEKTYQIRMKIAYLKSSRLKLNRRLCSLILTKFWIIDHKHWTNYPTKNISDEI